MSCCDNAKQNLFLTKGQLNTQTVSKRVFMRLVPDQASADICCDTQQGCSKGEIKRKLDFQLWKLSEIFCKSPWSGENVEEAIQ